MNDPADKVGSVALVVKIGVVWALTEVRAAAILKRKRKMRCMVVERLVE